MATDDQLVNAKPCDQCERTRQHAHIADLSEPSISIFRCCSCGTHRSAESPDPDQEVMSVIQDSYDAGYNSAKFEAAVECQSEPAFFEISEGPALADLLTDPSAGRLVFPRLFENLSEDELKSVKKRVAGVTGRLANISSVLAQTETDIDDVTADIEKYLEQVEKAIQIELTSSSA